MQICRSSYVVEGEGYDKLLTIEHSSPTIINNSRWLCWDTKYYKTDKTAEAIWMSHLHKCAIDQVMQIIAYFFLNGLFLNFINWIDWIIESNRSGCESSYLLEIFR